MRERVVSTGFMNSHQLAVYKEIQKKGELHCFSKQMLETIIALYERGLVKIELFDPPRKFATFYSPVLAVGRKIDEKKND